MPRIDLNADTGESSSTSSSDSDEGLMAVITSTSIAAGFHAGDPGILRRTIRLAAARGVAVGAHPGFPDRAGFGRREMPIAPRDAEELVLSQVGTVAGMAAAEGVRLQHVKPHGALFNMAAADARLAAAIARAVAAFDPNLILFGLSGSALPMAGKAAGLRVAAEVFADRAYAPDGSLVSRQISGAIIHDPELVVPRAVRMVMDGTVVAIDGTIIQLPAVDTICVHSDTPGADRLAARLRAGLEDAGVSVRAVGEP